MPGLSFQQLRERLDTLRGLKSKGQRDYRVWWQLVLGRQLNWKQSSSQGGSPGNRLWEWLRFTQRKLVRVCLRINTSEEQVKRVCTEQMKELEQRGENTDSICSHRWSEAGWLFRITLPWGKGISASPPMTSHYMQAVPQPSPRGDDLGWRDILSADNNSQYR